MSLADWTSLDEWIVNTESMNAPRGGAVKDDDGDDEEEEAAAAKPLYSDDDRRLAKLLSKFDEGDCSYGTDNSTRSSSGGLEVDGRQRLGWVNSAGLPCGAD